MFKFLHITWISNSYIFLTYLSHDFKYVILSCLNELLGLRYIVEKFSDV